MTESSPQRIRMTRTKPWRHLSPDAIIVARQGGGRDKWGNPFIVNRSGKKWAVWYSGPRQMDSVLDSTHTTKAAAHGRAVELFRFWLAQPDAYVPLGGLVPITVSKVQHAAILRDIGELDGLDLACWCAPELPCHADVLLELAKQSGGSS